METSTTIWKCYQKAGIRLSKKQLMYVGLKARDIYQQITGELPPKIEQQEPISINYTSKNPKLITYQVFAYPAEFEVLIMNLLEEEAKKHTKKVDKPKEQVQAVC